MYISRWAWKNGVIHRYKANPIKHTYLLCLALRIILTPCGTANFVSESFTSNFPFLLHKSANKKFAYFFKIKAYFTTNRRFLLFRFHRKIVIFKTYKKFRLKFPPPKTSYFLFNCIMAYIFKFTFCNTLFLP